MKRILSLALSAVIIATSVPFAYATNNYDQGTKVEYTAANNESYTITVPALLQPGQSGNVNLEGSWAENRIITVTADKTVTLTNSIKSSDTKVLDIYFEGISEKGNNTNTQTFTEPVSIKSINNALFGTWSGRFNYNVISSDVAIKAEISVQATDKDGNDLNAKSYVINGNEKDQLLLELKNSDLIDNTEDVDALIEVKSDDFEDLADTTFDVSSIAQPGDKVVILHYNEETREWEYISEETVSAEGKVNADFSSYSPVAFVVVKEDGTIGGIDSEDTSIYIDGDYIYYRRMLAGNDFGARTLEEGKTLCKEMLMEETGLSWNDFLSMVQQNIELDTGLDWSDFVDAEGLTGYTPEDFVFLEYNLTEETFEPSVFSNEWMVDLNLEVTNREKTSYGPILDYINGLPVTSLNNTFRDCTNLTVDGIPTIPNTITNMSATFAGCMSLTDLSNFNIPDSVTNLHYCFAGCDYLTDAPEMPPYLVDMGYTFFECNELINGPSSIPSTVENMMEAFNFSGLQTTPDMSNAISVTNLQAAFGGCDITIPPDLTNCTKITNMKYAFADCPNLTAAPIIHSTVTNLYGAFRRCYNLTGVIEINANPNDYTNCFWKIDMSKITLTGTSTLLNEIGATGDNYQAK